jgi:hypothetical protein
MKLLFLCALLNQKSIHLKLVQNKKHKSTSCNTEHFTKWKTKTKETKLEKCALIFWAYTSQVIIKIDKFFLCYGFRLFTKKKTKLTKRTELVLDLENCVRRKKITLDFFSLHKVCLSLSFLLVSHVECITKHYIYWFTSRLR